MKTTTHLNVSIEGLINRDNEFLRILFHQNGELTRAELLLRRKKGEIYVQCEDCDNFDPVYGCLGHVTEADL